MPELPEVQTVVSDLNKKIKGDTIVDFRSEWPSAIKNATLENFKKEIIGRKILGARRIGKNIFIDLSGGKTMYVHLKMTGHLLVKSESTSRLTKAKSPRKGYFDDRVNQYIRHSWRLKGKNGKMKDIDFSDVRKFAKIVIVDTDKVGELKEIKALGIDALDPALDFQKFSAIIARRPNAPIGAVIMDQSLLAGVGNIYRSEIMFAAGVDPLRPVKKTTPAERKKVFTAMRKVLELAVKLRGTSDSDYRDTSGAPGGFQKVLKVYRRAGQKCPRCAKMIKRLIIGQRSAFMCPACQK